jgi:hypothetical protein
MMAEFAFLLGLRPLLRSHLSPAIHDWYLPNLRRKSKLKLELRTVFGITGNLQEFAL